MKKEIRTIWNANEEYDSEENLEYLREEYPDCTKDELLDIAYSNHEDNLEFERDNLAVLPVEGDILILGELGTWHGKIPGYKILKADNVSDILYSNVNGTSDCHWYSDGENICCDESHHDGTNHYIYREIKKDRNIETLLSKIYHGEQISRQMLSSYTKSLQPKVASVYGW